MTQHHAHTVEVGPITLVVTVLMLLMFAPLADDCGIKRDTTAERLAPVPVRVGPWAPDVSPIMESAEAPR